MKTTSSKRPASFWPDNASTKPWSLWRACALALPMLLAALDSECATVRYVNANSASPAPPYTSWATAARVIQDAVDAAVSGDEIVVTNGTYDTGGRTLVDLTTNRVAVNKVLRKR